MAVLPIIERELRVALRKQRPVRRRLMTAGGCAALVLFLLLLDGAGSHAASRQLHLLLCWIGLICLAGVPQSAAGAFAQERREQTLGLLFLSGLGAGEVFVSKLCSVAAIAGANLFAIFPMLALPFLMGGVSFELFLATICCLPNLLLFALAVSLLASVLTEDEGVAVMLAAAITLALCAPALAVTLAKTLAGTGAAPSPWWFRLCPAYGPYLVIRRFGGTPPIEFWRNFAATLAISSVCFAAAAIRLRSLWRERTPSGSESRWSERWRELVRGTPRWRTNLAGRWLDVNAFAWLAARDRRPALLAWIVVGGIAGAWLTGWAVWHGAWLSIPNLFLTAILLNVALRWSIRYAAAGLGAPRQDGGYELLLTTPLNPSDVVWGHLEALREHFHKVRWVVLIIELLLLAIGLTIRPWHPTALCVYLVVWFGLLCWHWIQAWDLRSHLLTAWAGLNCARPLHATFKTSWKNSSWFWFIWVFSASRAVRTWRVFPTGSIGEMVVVFVFLIVFCIYLSQVRQANFKTEQRLVTEFREIVREPLPDPDDPRWKKWDVRERFPWGWEMSLQQLHERLARTYSGTKPRGSART